MVTHMETSTDGIGPPAVSSWGRRSLVALLAVKLGVTVMLVASPALPTSIRLAGELSETTQAQGVLTVALYGLAVVLVAAGQRSGVLLGGLLNMVALASAASSTLPDLVRLTSAVLGVLTIGVIIAVVATERGLRHSAPPGRGRRLGVGGAVVGVVVAALTGLAVDDAVVDVGDPVSARVPADDLAELRAGLAEFGDDVDMSCMMMGMYSEFGPAEMAAWSISGGPDPAQVTRLEAVAEQCR